MTTTERVTPGGGSVDTGQWQAQAWYDDGALEALGDEWEDLYRRCGSATPFTSHAWLDSWWRSYGRPGRLVVVAVRRSGLLVGAAALVRVHRAGLRVLMPVGLGLSDFGDVLLDDAYAGTAARHLARELARRGRCDAVDLPEVRQDAAVWRVVDAWPGRSWRLPASVCQEMRAQPLDDWIRGLPRRHAKDRRRRSRQIEKAGIGGSPVGSGEAARMTGELLRLHHQQWQGRGLNPAHARPEFARHLARAVPTMIARGQARLAAYRVGADLVAVDLSFPGHHQLYWYLYGFRPDLRQRIEVAQLLLGDNLAECVRLGLPTLNLCRGDEPYKQTWLARKAPNGRVVLAGTGQVRARLYATGVTGRHALASGVKRRLPGIGNLVQRIRSGS